MKRWGLVAKIMALLLALALPLAGCGTTAKPPESEGDTSLTDNTGASVEQNGTESAWESGGSESGGESEATAGTDASGNPITVGPTSSKKTGSGTTSTSSRGGTGSAGTQPPGPTAATTTRAPQPGEAQPLPVRDALLVYCTTNLIAESAFLPAAGYTVGGVVKDTLYDSFIFLPNPNYVYDYNTTSLTNGMRQMKKTDWSDYITKKQYVSGMNFDALDSAVAKTAAAIGKPYKANVFFSLFTPVRTVTSWGEAGGRTLNFSKLEDRKAALKWMVDEHLAQFKAKNYKNLHAAGFYWFAESMYADDPDLKELVKYVTTYVRSLGLVTTWSPYYGARGYTEWKDYGLDMTGMQANYFPPGNGWPNSGGIERLTGLQNAVNAYGVGANMELGKDNAEGYTIFKQYMKHGAKSGGFMSTFHMYYMNGTVTSIRTMCNSRDEYTRSTYDELYKYIKKTLKESEVVIK